MTTTVPSWMDRFRVDWPEETVGDCRIERRTVGDDPGDMLVEFKQMLQHGRGAPMGLSVTMLYQGGQLWMSDTPDEIRDQFEVYHRATGRVLIHGLGLGCTVKAVLSKPEVTHVDVVELNPDIVKLVGQYFADDPRVNIVEGDCFTYKWPAGTRWDVVWHDIWPNISEDNLDQMATLHRKFGRRCDWQASWCHARLLVERRRNRYAPWNW